MENKICTSLEQSKKLLELGIDVNTADMYYTTFYGKVDKDLPLPKEVYDILKYPINEDKIIHAWSLSALLGLMPKHIKQEDGRVYKFYIFNDNGRVIQRWGCSYVAEDYHNRAEYLSDPTLKYPTNIYTDKCKEPLDAAFEMVVWLKENNKI